jgi:hypothetical protein
MINKEQLKSKLDSAKIKNLQSSNKILYPSQLQMAKNLGTSIARNMQSVISGNGLRISDEEASRRLDICNSCEFFDQIQKRCRKCGCYMAVKTYLKAEKCPIGKW